MTIAEHNKIVRRLIKCCDEAIDGSWDKDNDGFEAMKDDLEKLKITGITFEDNKINLRDGKHNSNV